MELCRKETTPSFSTDTFELGDQWVFVALDADSKLIPSYIVGKRTADNAEAFMSDLAGRLDNRVQISSDALRTSI